MTVRQKLLRLAYPFFRAIKKLQGARYLENKNLQHGEVQFHSLSVQLNNGQTLSFENLHGRKVMLVNTASDCGFTNQYAELQKLYSVASGQFMIIGFPSNDFREQEKGTDDDIAAFCKNNFGITFPLARKSTVTRNDMQHPVFDWLSDKKKNGWNDQPPAWNFSKYIVNENGILTHYFDPAVSPLSSVVLNALKIDNTKQLAEIS